MTDDRGYTESAARPASIYHSDNKPEDEERTRDEIIHNAHKEDYDPDRRAFEFGRVQQLKSEGKNPKDYGYDSDGIYQKRK
jgi:hypothetical protein